MHLATYLGLLHTGEQTLAASMRQVADGHADESDVHHQLHLLAGWCDAHVDALSPLVERYGEHPAGEPERLHAAVPGDPTDPSPYRPSSRRFPDPVHLRVEAVPEYAYVTGLGTARLDGLLEQAAALRAAVLDKGALIQILREPKNSLVRQYQTMMGFENVQLKFTDDALEAIAEEALKRNVGARGLKIIIEELMLDVMYTIPSESSIAECVVTREVVLNRSQPITLFRKAG